MSLRKTSGNGSKQTLERLSSGKVVLTTNMDKETEQVQVTGNVPPKFTLPTLSIGQIRSQIPAHCFERDAIRSMGYVVADGVIITSLWWLATWIDIVVPAGPLRWAVWAGWMFLQGCFFTGWWVLAHGTCTL
jgi:hypothetical protein